MVEIVGHLNSVVPYGWGKREDIPLLKMPKILRKREKNNIVEEK